jgi:aldose 1-epimerase
VRWVPWHVSRRDDDAVVLEHVLYPRPGYPFTLALAVAYTLSADGLSVRTTATNAGDAACLFGCGAHPYVTVGTVTVDSAVLTVPAGTVLRSNERGLPVERLAVDGTDLDFRRSRQIGSTVLDHAFTDLVRDADGLARVELRDPDSGHGVALWLDGAFSYVMVFSGDPLPDVKRRSLAVEPMTCPPNAFRNGEAMRLEPGASTTAAWGLVTDAGSVVRSG